VHLAPSIIHVATLVLEHTLVATCMFKRTRRRS
jgi:hypothetical protein